MTIRERQSTHRNGVIVAPLSMGVILLYDLDRRSTRNLGVLRNFDTGAALNAGSTRLNDA